MVCAPHLPAPRDMGISGKMHLDYGTDDRIKSITVDQTHEKDGKVTLDVHVVTASSADARTLVTLTSPLGKVYYAPILSGVGRIIIPDPMLWWPHNMGTPYLYTLTVSLYVGNEAQDIRTTRIGLCKKELSSLDGGSGISIKIGAH